MARNYLFATSNKYVICISSAFFLFKLRFVLDFLCCLSTNFTIAHIGKISNSFLELFSCNFYNIHYFYSGFASVRLSILGCCAFYNKRPIFRHIS